jgi:hypothetical protein
LCLWEAHQEKYGAEETVLEEGCGSPSYQAQPAAEFEGLVEGSQGVTDE